MQESKKIDLIVFLTLFLMGVAAVYSFYIDRYIYWFPEWFTLSLEKGIAFDIPRYSFSIFQLPSGFLKWLQVNDYARLKLVGLFLTLYPFVSLYLIWRLLKNSAYKFFLYPLSFCFLSFFWLTSAPSFNGALHSFVFFWILTALLITKYKNRFIWLFSFLYIIFYFFYPPASFTGSILFSFKLYKKRDFNFYLTAIGSLLSLCYLIFFPHFSEYPIYTETIIGFKGTIFSPLALLYILLIYFLFRFKYATEKRVYFHVLLILFLAFHIYEGWNIFLLGHQYHYRVFVYTLGFLPFLLIDKFKGLEKIDMKLINSFSVFLVLIFLADIRASFLFQKDIRLLENIVSHSKDKEKCRTIPPLEGLISHYDDINSLTWLIPKLRDHGQILLPEKSYTNKIYQKYCF